MVSNANLVIYRKFRRASGVTISLFASTPFAAPFDTWLAATFVDVFAVLALVLQLRLGLALVLC